VLLNHQELFGKRKIVAEDFYLPMLLVACSILIGLQIDSEKDGQRLYSGVAPLLVVHILGKTVLEGLRHHRLSYLPTEIFYTAKRISFLRINGQEGFQ